MISSTKERKQVGMIENHGGVGLLWTEWQEGLGEERACKLRYR